MLEGLSRTVIELSGMPQSRKPDEWPATIDLPGLEQFGGVKAAAALSAPSAALALWKHRGDRNKLAQGRIRPRRGSEHAAD